LGTDAGEHDDFRIGRAGLRSGGADEGSVSLRIVLKSLRLNVDDVGIARGVACKTEAQIGVVLSFSVAVWRQNRDEIDGRRRQEQESARVDEVGGLLQ